jgi:hypothetical protein
MSPDHALTIIRAFVLPTWLGGKVSAFTPSGGIKSELNERDSHLRAPLGRRLKVILWGCNVVMHVVYLLFCMAAVIKSTVDGILINKGSTEQTLLYMLTHACWPPILWLIAVNACWAPVHSPFGLRPYQTMKIYSTEIRPLVLPILQKKQNPLFGIRPMPSMRYSTLCSRFTQ